MNNNPFSLDNIKASQNYKQGLPSTRRFDIVDLGKPGPDDWFKGYNLGKGFEDFVIAWVAKKKADLEEKEFNKNFEKEYGEQAIKNHVRAKVNKNRREGKKDYENLSINDIIVNEHTKDKAKEQLAAIKPHLVKLEPSYIDYRLSFKDTEPTISLEEHMARTAPKEIDPGGITDLDGVREFKDTISLANKKFPTRSRGLGPLLGEDS